MFWWLYYTSSSDGFQSKPLIIWLQGGPGGSSCGFGNFGELGPLDTKLQPRNTTWLSRASLLFIDNPVGAGFSYVTSDDAYTTDVTEIAADLLTTLTAFLKQVPEFQNIPIYIFSESYGGKMTAAFSQAIHQAVQQKTLVCNFKGFAMGDSWISPIDSVKTWGPYLYTMSLIDENGLVQVNNLANKAEDAIAAGEWTKSTQLWAEAEDLIDTLTDGVNLYNILKWNSDEEVKDHTLYFRKAKQALQGSAPRISKAMVGAMANDELASLMNGKIRKKLGIIPDSVTWGGQSGAVFDNQREDFMKPVINIVDDLLNNTDLQVIVYTGQLDLIVDTLGTEQWVGKLSWPGLAHYLQASRVPLLNPTTTANIPLAYVKQYKNLSFYWILNAGHMVPQDSGLGALLMIDKILSHGSK